MFSFFVSQFLSLKSKANQKDASILNKLYSTEYGYTFYTYLFKNRSDWYYRMYLFKDKQKDHSVCLYKVLKEMSPDMIYYAT